MNEEMTDTPRGSESDATITPPAEEQTGRDISPAEPQPAKISEQSIPQPQVAFKSPSAKAAPRRTLRSLVRRLKGYAISIGFGIIIAAMMLASIVIVPSLRVFFSERMTANGLGMFMVYWIAGMVILVAVMYAQIIIHEGGHLVCGLASGYRFVSFRVASLILYRDGSRLRFGRFSIAGTAGQCLLEPPTGRIEDADRMPLGAYFMGGAAANLTVAAAAAALLATGIQNTAAAFTASMFLFTGIVTAAMNGLPIRVGGMPNDGFNARIMRRDIEIRRMLWIQLTVNAQYSRGRLLRDMPDEWFAIPQGADLANHMYTSVALFDVWRQIERRDFAAADDLLLRLHLREGRMIELYRLETAADRMFVAVMLQRPLQSIRNIFTDRVRAYVAADARYNISHALELYAWERFVEGDAERAADRAETIRRALPRHHAGGEAADCAELLAWMETLPDNYLCN